MDDLRIRAEQALLGAVLADPAGQQHVLDLVQPADLGRPWHVQVLAAMRRVQRGGAAPGPLEGYTELKADPDLPGSVSRDAVPLVDLMEATPDARHAPAYAAMVIDGSIRQRKAAPPVQRPGPRCHAGRTGPAGHQGRSRSAPGPG